MSFSEDDSAARSRKPARSSTKSLSTSGAPEGTADPVAQPEFTPKQIKKNAGATKLLAATFGEIISLLMRAPQYRAATLADLDWLVVPAVLSRQFSLAEARSKKNGLTTPVALVMWANVSKDVDARLSQEIDKPIKLAPAEWRCGDIVWVVEALGDARVLEAMLKQLVAKQWPGKQVKLRTKKDGKPVVGVLGLAKKT